MPRSFGGASLCASMAGECIFRNAVATRDRHSTQAYREFTQHRNLNRFASQVREHPPCFVSAAGAYECVCACTLQRHLFETLFATQTTQVSPRAHCTHALNTLTHARTHAHSRACAHPLSLSVLGDSKRECKREPTGRAGRRRNGSGRCLRHPPATGPTRLPGGERERLCAAVACCYVCQPDTVCPPCKPCDPCVGWKGGKQGWGLAGAARPEGGGRDVEAGA